MVSRPKDFAPRAHLTAMPPVAVEVMIDPVGCATCGAPRMARFAAWPGGSEAVEQIDHSDACAAAAEAPLLAEEPRGPDTEGSMPDVETADCDFCGSRADVAVSEQERPNGARICGDCARWALEQLDAFEQAAAPASGGGA